MSHPDIQIIRMRYLSGPNIWTYRSVIEAWVDLGELEQYPSNTSLAFTTDCMLGCQDSLSTVVGLARGVDF